MELSNYVQMRTHSNITDERGKPNNIFGHIIIAVFTCLLFRIRCRYVQSIFFLFKHAWLPFLFADVIDHKNNRGV